MYMVQTHKWARERGIVSKNARAGSGTASGRPNGGKQQGSKAGRQVGIPYRRRRSDRRGPKDERVCHAILGGRLADVPTPSPQCRVAATLPPQHYRRFNSSRSSAFDRLTRVRLCTSLVARITCAANNVHSSSPCFLIQLMFCLFLTQIQCAIFNKLLHLMIFYMLFILFVTR